MDVQYGLTHNFIERLYPDIFSGLYFFIPAHTHLIDIISIAIPLKFQFRFVIIFTQLCKNT